MCGGSQDSGTRVMGAALLGGSCYVQHTNATALASQAASPVTGPITSPHTGPAVNAVCIHCCVQPLVPLSAYTCSAAAHCSESYLLSLLSQGRHMYLALELSKYGYGSCPRVLQVGPVWLHPGIGQRGVASKGWVVEQPTTHLIGL